MFALRLMRWAGNATFMAEIRNAYKLLDGKPGKIKPFLRSEVDRIYLNEQAYMGASEVGKISYVEEVLPSFGNYPTCMCSTVVHIFTPVAPCRRGTR
jgi:hypothetical protein